MDRGQARAARRERADRHLTRALAHPVRLVPLSFLGVIAVGALFLMLPFSRAEGDADALTAVFTSVSAVCVTGLSTVDTATHWSPFGQLVILLLMQVGGFGIMTLATLLALLVRGRVDVTGQLRARAETHAFDAGGSVATLIRRIAVRMLAAEAVVAVLLTIRFRIGYLDSLGTAAWHGVFHSVSAFTNASFMLYSDNFTRFAGDPWVCLPVCFAIVAGGIGFPVYFELVRRWRRPSTWSVHTRITVGGTLLLLVLGTLVYLVFEWSNPRTMGPMPLADKLLASGTASVVARTAGFATFDYGAITPATLVVTLVLMFVGGGSAGTAGGIKVTTFFLLGFLILAEARGEEDVVVGRRRVGPAVQRQAVAVALLGVGVVATGTIAMVILTGLPLDAVTFEVVSAFGTVRLSTGITPRLGPAAQVVLMLMMFVGRVGTVSLASALAMRRHKASYHYPQERPIVG